MAEFLFISNDLFGEKKYRNRFSEIPVIFRRMRKDLYPTKRFNFWARAKNKNYVNLNSLV